jgi:hypothetical protein
MSALSEFVEAQRELEKMARNIVNSLRKLVDTREKLVPANPRDFPGYDSKFYDGTAKELASLGLRVLGDFADAGMLEKPAEERSFYRFALSEAGGTAAWWFMAPPSKKKPMRCLYLKSWLESGGSIATGRGGAKGSIPRPASIRTQELQAGTSTAKVIDAQRYRCCCERRCPSSVADDK